jgi:hypothetical protein
MLQTDVFGPVGEVVLLLLTVGGLYFYARPGTGLLVQ